MEGLVSKKKWEEKRKEALCSFVSWRKGCWVPLPAGKSLFSIIGQRGMWESGPTWGALPLPSALEAPKVRTWFNKSLSPRVRPTHSLPEREFFTALLSPGGYGEFQLVHVDPITAHYMAISWGGEIIQFCSFPAHKHKAIIYNILCQTQALSSSAFCPWHQEQGRFCEQLHYLLWLPRWLCNKESACQCRRLRFNPWAKKIPWRRKWHPLPVSLAGESHGPRSLVGYSPWGSKESDTTWLLSTQAHMPLLASCNIDSRSCSPSTEPHHIPAFCSSFGSGPPAHHPPSNITHMTPTGIFHCSRMDVGKRKFKNEGLMAPVGFH